jgi:thiol:disulfide interchange protein
MVWSLTAAVALAVYSGDEAPASATQGVSPSATLKAPQAQAGGTSAQSLTAISWQPSFEEAMQRARRENKPVMVDFYTDWCSWCKVLDQKVYPNNDVIAESANWVSVKINAEKRTDLAQQYNVSGFPTIAFLRPDGHPLSIVPGFEPAPDFVNSMRQARSRYEPSV